MKQHIAVNPGLALAISLLALIAPARASATLTYSGCVAAASETLTRCATTVPNTMEIPWDMTTSGGNLYVGAWGGPQSGNADVAVFSTTGGLTYTGAVQPADEPIDPNGGSSAISPDGTSVYEFENTPSGAAEINEFSRNPGTGALTPSGCVGEDGTTGCATIDSSLQQDINYIAVSPNGKVVYVATAGSGDESSSINDYAVLVFARDPATGALTQTECLGTVSGCTRFPKVGFLPYPQDTPIAFAFSPDGTELYINQADEITTWSVDPATGALTFTGCIGIPSGCTQVPAEADGQQFPAGMADGTEMLMSPDGRDLYVLSSLLPFPNGPTNQPAGIAVLLQFARNTGTGALSYVGCIQPTNQVSLFKLPGCADTAVGTDFAAGLAIAPDGSAVWIDGDDQFSAPSETVPTGGGVIDIFSRAADLAGAPAPPAILTASTTYSPRRRERFGPSILSAKTSHQAQVELLLRCPDGFTAYCTGALLGAHGQAQKLAGHDDKRGDFKAAFRLTAAQLRLLRRLRRLKVTITFEQRLPNGTLRTVRRKLTITLA